MRQLKSVKVELVDRSIAGVVYKTPEGVMIHIPIGVSEDTVLRNQEQVRLQELPLNERIKKMRELLGLNQRDMAALCDVTQAEISVLERGDSRMGYSIMKKLQKGLNVDFMFFDED